MIKGMRTAACYPVQVLPRPAITVANCRSAWRDDALTSFITPATDRAARWGRRRAGRRGGDGARALGSPGTHGAGASAGVVLTVRAAGRVRSRNHSTWLRRQAVRPIPGHRRDPGAARRARHPGTPAAVAA